MIGGASGVSSNFAATLAGPRQAPSTPPPAPPASQARAVPTGATLPGQAGAGIGDLQSVAQSSIARGKIADLAT